MGNLKVLPVQTWMRDASILKQLPADSVIFERDGWYLLNTKCWCEVDGKSYKVDPSYMKQVLDIKERVINYDEYKALVLLKKSKLTNARQNKLIKRYERL